MRKFITYVVVMLISLSISLAPVSALAMEDTEVYVFRSEPTAAAMIGDVLVVRPFALVGLGVTSLSFLISWPFSALGGNSDVAKQKLLKEPVNYTFKRPLGDF